ncbi:MAG: hypothetical protein E6K16_00135 [Methanobacteriota archaeon]|nr:MAG: hypothetical protein E6K16_00135 [Euryarchaeota archaeon]
MELHTTLHLSNSVLAMGILVVLLAILNEARRAAPATIARLVLRTRETTRAAIVLVVALFFFLISHVVELFGDFLGTASAEAAHEFVETVSLVILLTSHVLLWRIVRARLAPGKITSLPVTIR